MSQREDSATAAVVACPGCGRKFFCDPHGNCWCMALPPAHALPRSDDEACLCPDCLEKREE